MGEQAKKRERGEKPIAERAQGSCQALHWLALAHGTMLASKAQGHAATASFQTGLSQSQGMVPTCCLQLTVRRWRPCLKSLIPASLLSMHSRPPHWAITPAILYTSSSSSSSSVGEGEPHANGGEGELGNKTDGPLPG